MTEISRRILITGGTGMTGDAVVRRVLTTHPHAQLRATYRSVQPTLADPRLQWVKADLQQRADCMTAAQGCTDIIFTAASTGGAAAAASAPNRQLTENIVLDTMLMEAAHDAGIRRWVYLSSATVYQEFDGLIREDQLDMNQNPHAAYLGVGWAKRAAERFCYFWHARYGHEVVVLRCANIYGPRAKFDPATSNFIPALIRKAVDRLDPFEVWGSPSVMRDVLYADDAANAVALALDYDTGFDVLNLGSGSPVSVEQVVQAALTAADHKPESIGYSQVSSPTIAVRALDCGRIRKRLGWRPRVHLASGLRQTTRWWMQNKATWTR
jgi:nucleoside-diphosphate-sugar epimerase